jgi:Glycerol uptake facilitator and related permeases (Major Intrinsic Protein Family)
MMQPRSHLAEYGYEALGLGLFMISACGFGVLLFHPSSPLVQVIPGDVTRRALMGLAMGLTAIANIYSPWGRRSGAHLNPAVTLTFLRLGKLKPRDAAWYIAAQFAGGLLGTAIAALLLRRWIGTHQSTLWRRCREWRVCCRPSWPSRGSPSCSC